MTAAQKRARCEKLTAMELEAGLVAQRQEATSANPGAVRPLPA